MGTHFRFERRGMAVHHHHGMVPGGGLKETVADPDQIDDVLCVQRLLGIDAGMGEQVVTLPVLQVQLPIERRMLGPQRGLQAVTIARRSAQAP